MSNTQKKNRNQMPAGVRKGSVARKQLSGRRQSDRRAATRRAIMDAASEVFTAVGFEAAKTSDIAVRAGVAEGTIFLHFESKRGVLSAIMNKVFDEMIDGATEILSKRHDSMSSLKILTRHYVGVLEANWSIARVFGPYGRYDDGAFHEEFHRRNRHYTTLFVDLLDELKEEGRLRSNLSARLVRDTLFGGIEHFAIANFHQEKPCDLDVYLDDLWELLFQGAEEREEPVATSLQAIDQKLNTVLQEITRRPE